ncbi:MAG: D-alanyl-D-alanine carboxypeptidase family protein, partial [Firmicutes bacterium]|nr:D-alanyl-D-alanine carboxypeptidase family protein [Bacillota bacterium]
MRKQEPEQRGRICRKRNNKNRQKIARGFVIVILCLITFLIGRASAHGKDMQSASARLNQDKASFGQINNAQVSEKESTIKLNKNIDDKPQENQSSESTRGKSQSKEDNNITSKDAWNLMLVNKWHPIKESFHVDLTQLKDGQAIDARAYPDLQAMMDDARAAGLSPYICSSYRTTEKQTMLYNNQINKYKKQGYSEEDAKAEAGKWVAIPGTSEHQIGLAVDIVSISYQVLDKHQENTAEQHWLRENCYKYGFIL